MYTLKEILVKTNYRWSIITNNNTPILTLLNNHSQILVKLFNSETSTISQYDLKAFTNIRHLTDNLPLALYIKYCDELVPAPLTTIKDIKKPKRVNYTDIWKAGLNIAMGNFNDVILGASYNKPDLVVSKANTTITDFNNLLANVLFTVNGSIFFDHFKNNYCYLKKAGAYLNYFDTKHVSVIDFTAIGGITKRIITEDNASIFSSTEEETIIHVTTSETLNNKIILLVANGKLHILNGIYKVITDNKLAIRIKHNQVINELVNIPKNAVNWINRTSNHSNGWNLSTLDILAYITQGNSGIVILNTNALAIKELPILRTDFVGRYRIPRDIPDNAVMFLQDGTIAEYTAVSKTGYGTLLASTRAKIKNALKDTAAPLPRGVNCTTTTFASDPDVSKMVDLYIL